MQPGELPEGSAKPEDGAKPEEKPKELAPEVSAPKTQADLGVGTNTNTDNLLVLMT